MEGGSVQYLQDKEDVGTFYTSFYNLFLYLAPSQNKFEKTSKQKFSHCVMKI